MILAFIAILVVLAAAASVMYLLKRNNPDPRCAPALEPPVQRGLFDHSVKNAEQTELLAADEAFERRAALTKRAAAGEAAALLDAHELNDAKLCREVLDALVEQAATRRETLSALVSLVASSNGLRANIRMAELVIEAWKNEPTSRGTADTLHIAALSDDATTYQAAVELVSEYSRSGRLPQVSAADLIALAESQYWVLSSEARSSGAGFALKQRLARVRRELTAATSTR
ncbi:MAG: hypothetical protein AABO41_00765 [Acidobacteriota bacterium]